MNKFQQIFNVINVVFILTILLSCDGNVNKVKDTETPQGLNSLIGTEWVHSDDTDPETRNWFNVYHSPKHSDKVIEQSGIQLPYPAVIKFLEDGIISEPVGEYGYLPQYYRYSYNEPYVTITCGSADMESVEETQKKWNLCPLTIDEPMCDSSKCKNNKPNYGHGYCYCMNGYWFLGKVEGDTMHLQQMGLNTDGKFTIARDIYLIRRK